MDTPMEIARENYYNKHGYYPEDLKREHPCYSCIAFDRCDGVEYGRCEDYTEESED